MPLGEDLGERSVQKACNARLYGGASACASHDLRHELSRLAEVLADAREGKASAFDGVSDLERFHFRGVVTLHVKLPPTIHMQHLHVN